MKNPFSGFIHNFLCCGITGWCMEILFTAYDSLRRRELRLKGNTSLWMFPIYGCASLLAPVCRLLRRHPFWQRGLTYMVLIFLGEYASGSFLKQWDLCPWDYKKSRWNIQGIVRLDYAPCWFGAGLLFERLLRHK